MARIRIIATSGTTNDVKILDACGDEIQWGATAITNITIAPLQPNQMIEATITFVGVGLDLDAEAGLLPLLFKAPSGKSPG